MVPEIVLTVDATEVAHHIHSEYAIGYMHKMPQPWYDHSNCNRNFLFASEPLITQVLALAADTPSALDYASD